MAAIRTRRNYRSKICRSVADDDLPMLPTTLVHFQTLSQEVSLPVLKLSQLIHPFASILTKEYPIRHYFNASMLELFSRKVAGNMVERNLQNFKTSPIGLRIFNEFGRMGVQDAASLTILFHMSFNDVVIFQHEFLHPGYYVALCSYLGIIRAINTINDLNERSDVDFLILAKPQQQQQDQRMITADVAPNAGDPKPLDVMITDVPSLPATLPAAALSDVLNCLRCNKSWRSSERPLPYTEDGQVDWVGMFYCSMECYNEHLHISADS